MGDRYNCKCALLFAPRHTHLWAVTVGQTTYYSCPELEVTGWWRAHEDRHKQQWARDGLIKFLLKYTYYHVMYGHDRNPYEVDAELAAEEWKRAQALRPATMPGPGATDKSVLEMIAEQDRRLDADAVTEDKWHKKS